MGSEGQPGKLQHCDTRKGDQELRWNPAEPNHHIEERISYELDGSIQSNDARFDQELNEVLNLNLPLLKNNRKGLLDGLLQWWHQAKPVPDHRITQEIARWSGQNGAAELRPYCQVASFWLRRKLAG